MLHVSRDGPRSTEISQRHQKQDPSGEKWIMAHIVLNCSGCCANNLREEGMGRMCDAAGHQLAEKW
jgi:hypothetical protein